MIPSIKTIAARLGTDPETTRHIRKLMDLGHLRAMHAINKAINGSGVETLIGADGLNRGDYVEYVNFGDPYKNTVMFDAKHGRWIIGAWGDLVERQSRRFAN